MTRCFEFVALPIYSLADPKLGPEWLSPFGTRVSSDLPTYTHFARNPEQEKSGFLFFLLRFLVGRVGRSEER